MNIQTERLENHTARFTVALEESQWDQAKKDAAAEISKQIRVKGFRKGKAPYRMVVRTVGEAVIIEEAMEKLGNEVYREVIESTELEPYAPGNLEDFQLEPQPTYVFTVPLVPEIDLGNYREVRLDYEAPEVSDEDVDRMMRDYQQREAVVEDSANPVASGDRVTIDIESQFIDGPEAPEDDDEAEDAESDANIPYKGDVFAHDHDAIVNLDPENEPLLPGFIDALVGANVDETVEFDLSIPEDNDDYREEVRGRTVHFEVTIKDIKNVTLPELNDEFAAKVTEDEDEPLTLLGLRTRTREQLQEQAERNALNAYSDKVLDKIAEGATLSYPEVMVVDRIHDMINDLDQNLRQQGMDLETYQKVMGITHDDLHDQYEEDATKSLERSLVLGEVLVQEGVKVTADDVAAEIDKTLAQFGEQADMFRQFFDNEQQRSNIANNILYERVMERLAKIGKGEPLDEPEAEEDSAEASDDTETADEPQASVEAEDATQDAEPQEVSEADAEEETATEESDEETSEESETDDTESDE